MFYGPFVEQKVVFVLFCFFHQYNCKKAQDQTWSSKTELC